MLEISELKSSIEQSLGKLVSRSNTLVLGSESGVPSDLNLEQQLGPVREPLLELLDLRRRYPSESITIFREYAIEVGETYEAITDLGDRVDACNRFQVIDLALEIRSLLELAEVKAAHSA
jgi:hypothetical protein